ncbi:MAG: methyltransferase domain-containing protein [Parcubacteria group bacterium]|nr:methyltransferase domain-containing protein [Parcubacteria group bacterium]
MTNKTFQEENWGGNHGDEYNERNPQTIEEMDALYIENYGINRQDLNKEFLENIPKDIKILEVGANVGSQLDGLQKMGFEKLYGVDINRDSIETAKNNLKGVDIILASASDLPFKDNYFDLVFTSGVLIHISPDNIKTAMKEITRCSKKYIWGLEYFADTHTEIPYRGKNNLLWKADFSKLYLDVSPELKLVKEKKIKYKDSENVDSMFLLEKNV